MKFKKYFSAVLVIVLLLSSINISFAENNELSENAEGSYELSGTAQESYEVLTALGFLNSDYTEEYIWEKQNETVTRAYFAEFIYNIFCKNNRGSGKVYFYDVPKTYYAFNAISALTETGIISQSEDRTFEPEREITRTEAAKMLLYAIGYDTVIGYSGGWESGINTTASKIDLFDGVSSASKITFADMLVMTYNSLFAEILETTGIDGADIVMKSRGGTYLSAYYDIYMENGLLTGYSGTGIYGDKIDENEAVIDERILDAGNIDLTDYIGMQVTYIYRYDENRDESVLLWLKKTDESKEIVLNRIDNSFEYDERENSIHYDTDDGKKTKSASLSDSFTLILNGDYVTGDILQVMKSDLYRLRLVASKGSRYDIVFADRYENYEVVTNDINNEALYLKSCDNSEEIKYTGIKLEDYEIVNITDASGGSVAQSVISAGNIVSVFDTNSKNKIKICVSNSTITGKISAISDEDVYTVLEIDGTEYKVYKPGIILNESINSQVEAKLDVYGYIASLETKKGGVCFGYMIKAGLPDDVEGRLGEKVLAIKMFTEDGKIVTFYAPEKKIKIDGVDYKDHAVAFDELGGKGMNSQLVAYSLNSKNEINMIDRAEPYSIGNAQPDNSLQCVQEKLNLGYNGYTKNLGLKARIATSTITFGVPSDTEGALDTQYSVGGSSYFQHDYYHTIAAYVYGTDEYEYADAVVVYDAVIGVPYWVSTGVVVDRVSHVLNNDGEEVVQVEGYHGNTKKSIKFTPKASELAQNLKKGDIIGVGSARLEDFDSFEIRYSPATPENRPINRTYMVGGGRTTMYYVHDIVGTSIQVGIDSGENFDELITNASATVLVYDTDKETLTEGSFSDIYTYKTHGNNCSSIYVYYVNGEVRNFVVYN